MFFSSSFIVASAPLRRMSSEHHCMLIDTNYHVTIGSANIYSRIALPAEIIKTVMKISITAVPSNDAMSQDFS